jgi:hypothetical protein
MKLEIEAKQELERQKAKLLTLLCQGKGVESQTMEVL